MKYNGILLADVHWGVMPDEQLRFEMNEIFINYISNLERLDFIVILGDWFDHKVYLNTSSADSAFYYMDKILTIASSKRAKVRVVYGTESHECNQYKIFTALTNHADVDFKIIKTVSDEELFEGVHVLYLPEEHVIDKREYYKEYIGTKKYNYIFGHGIIQEAMTNAVRSINSGQKKLKVPVFTSKELVSTADDVYFGHYHINTEIEPNCHYLGSFSRWQFGQEEDKGFYHITYDQSKKKYSRDFIVNHLAHTYATRCYGKESSIFKSQDNLIKECDKALLMISNGICDNLRLIVNIPDGFENEALYADFLKERFTSNPHIKVLINSLNIKKDEESDIEELRNLDDKYGYLFDETPIEEKIRLFILNEYDANINNEKIRFYLTRKDRN